MAINTGVSLTVSYYRHRGVARHQVVNHIIRKGGIFDIMSQKASGYVPSQDKKRHTGGTLGLGIYKEDTLVKVLNEIKDIPISDNESFTIGDYGAADGRASMDLIKRLILFVRKLHGAQTEVKVVYEDLPTNNFNSLISNISGTVSDMSSYLEELECVYPFVTGIEFRKQVVPSDSMHFIFSTNCIQWLSELPIKMKDAIIPSFSVPLPDQEICLRQAKRDWAQFLKMRSKELKTGGLLMVTCPWFTENGFCGINYVALLESLWKLYRDNGTISGQEFLDTNFAAAPQSPDDLRRPFDDKMSEAYTSGLRLVSTELVIKDSPSYTIWKRKLDNEGVDDRAEFVRNYMDANWYWSYGTFLSSLSGERSETEKHELLDKLYQDLEKEMRGINPEDFKGDFVYTFMLIRKE